MLFGHLINIIGGVFFPSDDQLTSVLKAFGVFAVGFLMRPVGAAIFGHIGYQSIGILASMLVVCLRLLQGISLGGEAGNAPFLIEHAPKNKKGFFGSIEVLSAIFGSVLSLIAVLICKKVRYSGFGLSRNIAAGFFGGLAPFICTTIIKVTGQETSASFYMIFCALIGLVAISQIKD
ncbi:PREDICTED: uncharacterized protein LOC105558238 [Vollenhovia emeryi]|uniref:uncharacterized protein LOC105558238 n=1 Tax=Vollenhovia emeryi TaxID=411798 RepID=UPI0005F5577E|nr:PREDICTED: uncharacterized protein LOC105558238 [Vollenhovia emeryi]